MNQVVKRIQAERDLEECFVFIGTRDLDAGFDFLAAAEQTFDFLAGMPFIGSGRRFRAARFRRHRDLRQWPVKGYEDYLIFYRPTAGGIEVWRVLHARRDIEGIFAEDA